MSSAEIIKKIEQLPYETSEMKSAVLVASIVQDFGPIVEGLMDVDKELLAKTLVSHSKAKQEGGLTSDDYGKIKDLALSSEERDAALRERERVLEPCTLNEQERQKLFAECQEKIDSAFSEAQDRIVELGKRRDGVEPDSVEDRKLEKEMESLFEITEDARKLTAMWEMGTGKVYSETFWSTLVLETDPMLNKDLIGLADIWDDDTDS